MWIIAILIAIWLLWGLLKTAESARQLAGQGEWGRFAIAAAALSAPVAYALIYGVN